MLRSYIKMAWRNLIRNRVSSAINIGGLMMGLTTGIIICLYIVNQIGFDSFHTNYDNIHLLMKNQNLSTNIETRRTTPAPLGPTLPAKIPNIKYTARVTEITSLVGLYEKKIYQKSIATDPDFFKIMTFPAIDGDPTEVLQDASSVIITESLAKRLLNQNGGSILGKTILVDNIHPLKVGAVIKDVPQNSSLQFDLILPFSLIEKDNPLIKSWESSNVFTYVLTQSGANLTSINRQITDIVLANEQEKNVSVFAYPLKKLTLFNHFTNGHPSGGKIYLVLIMGTLGFFVLLIACINFMNLSTAIAERRTREVGLRKVLGATRKLIIIQFLGESLLLTFIAVLLSTLLAYLVLPSFMAFTGQYLASEFLGIRFWIVLFVLAIFTGILAGSYPALYLSRFTPVNVLKHHGSSNRSKGGLRKSLVTLQFTISIFLIISMLVCSAQIDHVLSRPIGYESSNLVDITAEGDLSNHFELFENEIMKIPSVISSTAGSDNLLTFGNVQRLDWPGKMPDQDFGFFTTFVNYNWTKTTGIKFLEGRDFNSSFGSDSTACLINLAARNKMGLKGSAIGTKLNNHTIVGVFEDLVFNDPAGPSKPLIVYLSKTNLSHFIIRLDNDARWKLHLDQIEKIVKILNPSYPFSFRFIKDEYRQEFKSAYGIKQLVNVFGFMAIIISCLGLFGLASFVVERRTKEISIRKVLGASYRSIWLSLSKEFLKPVVLAFLVAFPLAILVMPKFLSTMDYHIQLEWWMFTIAGLIGIIVAVVTVCYHGMKAVSINPAKSLKMD